MIKQFMIMVSSLGTDQSFVVATKEGRQVSLKNNDWPNY